MGATKTHQHKDINRNWE